MIIVDQILLDVLFHFVIIGVWILLLLMFVPARGGEWRVFWISLVVAVVVTAVNWRFFPNLTLWSVLGGGSGNPAPR
jgi:uncharacterized membrane protein YvlD (DUF360 family)